MRADKAWVAVEVSVGMPVTWVDESVCTQRMSMNCCSHCSIVRAVQFKFVCGQ
jgi:hypothetical protein